MADLLFSQYVGSDGKSMQYMRSKADHAYTALFTSYLHADVSVTVTVLLSHTLSHALK